MFQLKPLKRKRVCPSYLIEALGLEVNFFIGLPEDAEVILDFHEQIAYELKPVDKASSRFNLEG
jgi:hypothetical protein